MAELSSTEKYSLNAEWFDPRSGILRKFFLNYFPFDGAVELFDRNANRMFLKRTRVENIDYSDIFPGNMVEIFSRQVKLTDYANEYTKRKMGVSLQKTLAIIKPDGIDKKGNILKILCENGFKVSKLKMLKLTKGLVEEIFEDTSNQNNLNHQSFVTSMISGPVIALELVAGSAGEKMKELSGDEDPEKARINNPGSIRACFGKDIINNVIHVEPCVKKSQKAADIIFGPKTSLAMNVDTSTVLLKDTTCCVIKPHALRDGNLGEIVSMIEENDYNITAMEMFYLDGASAEEFLEVYRGVVQEYSGMVTELMSGGCVAMEIEGPMGPETPIEFRKLVGPNDPEIAKQLRPNTIRAKFGKTVVKNAVHVTDLPDDALLEVEYFFKILNY